MKKWIIVLILIIGAAFGYPRWQAWRAASKPVAASARTASALVETRDIQFAVSAAGEIGPAEQVSVRPEVNGRISELPVDLGDIVKKGDLLFTLDDRDLQIEKESSQKEIERASLQLSQAERNYNRSVKLFEEKLISQELFEDTKTQFDLSKNALERSKKSLDLLNDRLRKTRVEAPFACTVLTRPISIGQAVSGSGGFNSGTEVLTIADLRTMIINAHINQADVTRLKSEQEVDVTVEAVAGLKVLGKIERVAPQAMIKNNVKGFAVRILLKDVDPRIRPGMTANIKIPVGSATDVVAVPLAAVFTEKNSESGIPERFVYLKKGNSYERRIVRVGISDLFFAEIQEGLGSGETVMLEMPKEEKAALSKSLAQKAGMPGKGVGGAPKPPGSAANSGGTGAVAGTGSVSAPKPGGTSTSVPAGSSSAR